jgi:Cd2+/Zn2+-exporting ATPase
LERDIAKLRGVEKAELNFAAAKMKVQGEADPESVIEEAKKHSVYAEVDGVPEAKVFLLSGLTCADCAAKLEKSITMLPSVVTAKLNFGAAKLTVKGNVDVRLVIEEASKEGVSAAVEGGPSRQKPSFLVKNKWLMISSLAFLILVLGLAADIFLHLPDIAKGIYFLAILTGGYATVRKAFLSFRRLNFDMNVLMTVAVTGAVLIGEWREGAVVAFLFSVSGALESYTFDKARQSIRSLMEIAPKAARIRREGHAMELPVEEIHPGDILLVKPGEKIAMDGNVISGYSAVNQAAITGESIPVDKVTGDGVYAGTLNLQGALEVRVTSLVSDTTIARIIEMVEEAQAQRAPSQTFVDKFAGIYTPVVIALAAGIAVLPPLFFGLDWYAWIYRGLALLVVSCPCALVVSTPVAIVSAIGNAAKNGVLIKGGAYLEETGALSVVAFDKTGTLTKGSPEVTDIITVGDINELELLRAAASVENLSEHPIAGAVVRKARENGIEPEPVVEFESLTGKGARAELDGKEIIVGSPKLFRENTIDLKAWENILNRIWSEGKTAMLVEINGKLAGILAVADTVREASWHTIDVLRSSGIKTVMLTGDNAVTAKTIAAMVGVDDFMAELLPEDKVTAVKGLLDRYGKVAMVGDGVNDAPALATATVGIAMGGAGTDTALETADIVLMADDLSKLPFAISLSRASLGVIKQNIAFSLVIKLAAVALVFPGWLTLWLAILADMGASVLVTLNGIRLMRVNPSKQEWREG